MQYGEYEPWGINKKSHNSVAELQDKMDFCCGELLCYFFCAQRALGKIQELLINMKKAQFNFKRIRFFSGLSYTKRIVNLAMPLEEICHIKSVFLLMSHMMAVL